MSLFLGFDTSNYTTSVALYDSALGQVTHVKKLLPVKEGQLAFARAMRSFTTCVSCQSLPILS